MVITCNGSVLADQVKLADTFFTRFIGLMGKKNLKDGEGLLLMRCSAIHCFFMKITIDAVSLSNNMTVLGIETLKPWHIGKCIKKTAHILELPANSANVSIGDILEICHH